MTIKQISLFLLISSISIINAMDPNNGTYTFNLDDLIECALDPLATIGKVKEGGCFHYGYLKSGIKEKTVNSKTLTNESKKLLTDYFFEKNEHFNPNETHSQRYNFVKHTGHIYYKIKRSIEHHHKISQEQKDKITRNLSETLMDIAVEHSGLKLSQDFDNILKRMASNTILTDEDKKIIKQHNEFIKKEYPWYNYTLRHHYPKIRLKAVHTNWKGERELDDQRISEIITIIKEAENKS